MLDIFSGLRLVVKRRSISIDNAIFRCHWFFTSTLLVSFSLIITARQYVGQPIECHSVNKLPDSLLNSYCWVQSTFIVPQACNQQPGIEVPFPCIDNTRGREIKVFAYYQWVGIVLFIQGLLFHLPYYLWKVWENGLIRAITGGLRVAVLSDQERAKKRDIVVEYIHEHFGCHKRYALKYFLCEFICLINLLAQLWATNNFFDGQFYRYGLEVMYYSSNQLGLAAKQYPANYSPISTSTNTVNSTSASATSTLPAQRRQLNYSLPAANKLQQQIQHHQQHQVDPMTFIFPRITKCTYYDFGSSGDVQKHDALCLLPLNIINEKIYIALWFWFLILALLTLLVIFYRLLAISSESVRCKGLISRCKLSSELNIRLICRHCDVGDWFLLYMVAENLDPLIMREIVASIAVKIRDFYNAKKDPNGSPEEASSPDDIHVLSTPRKFRLIDRSQQLSSCDESLPSSRRNSALDHLLSSAPAAATGGAGAIRKLRKRFSSKRLWSMDLGSGELRQQLFGQQPATNPDQAPAMESNLEAAGDNHKGAAAPLISQHSNGTRPSGANLSRMGSSSSGYDSFVMEMQCVDQTADSSANPLLRQRTVGAQNGAHQHANDNRISSTRTCDELSILSVVQ